MADLGNLRHDRKCQSEIGYNKVFFFNLSDSTNISVHCNLMLSVPGNIILHVSKCGGGERLITNSLDSPQDMEFVLDAWLLSV